MSARPEAARATLPDGPGSGGCRFGVWLVGASFALRLAHAAFLADSPLIRYPTIDPGAYLARAREILAGKVLPDDVFFQDPLYPYLLAGMLALTGGSLWGPYLVHAAVGALNVGLIFVLGRAYAGGRAAAAAGIAASVYGPFLYLDGLLEKNAFTIFFLLASLAVFSTPGDRSQRRTIASGFLLGCGTLLRGNLLLAVPVAAAILAWDRWARGWKAAAAAAACFLVASALPIAPVTVHNYSRSGDFILTTAQAGTAFYLGNNPENTSGGIHHVSFNRQIPEFEADDWKREAERRAGRPLTRKEVSAFWFAAAMRHVTVDPGFAWWTALLARKGELIVNAYEVPDNTTILYAEKHSPIVRWTPSRFATIAPLGILGVWFWARRRPRPRLLFAVFGVYAGSLLFFPVSDRFRAPLASFLLLSAGVAIDVVARALRARRWGWLCGAGAALAAAALLVNHRPWLQPPDSNLRPENARLKLVHDEAEAWIQAGEWGKARGVLDEASRDPWLSKKAQLVLDRAVVEWKGSGNLSSAKDLAARSVKAFIESGQSCPAGYALYAELCEAGGDPEAASYWRGRERGATAPHTSFGSIASSAPAAGVAHALAMGFADEIVFIDRRRPAVPVPAEAYVFLARSLRDRGDRTRAEDVVRALRARGGVVPRDLTPLLLD